MGDNSLRVVVFIGSRLVCLEVVAKAEGSPGLTPLATSSAICHREVFCKQFWRGWVFVVVSLESLDM